MSLETVQADTAATDDTQATAQQADETTTAQGQPDEGADPSTPPEVADDADVKELYAKLDPALRKHLNKVFTQKTQKIAEERKTLETKAQEIEREAALIAALRQDPETTVRGMAQQLGIPLAKKEDSDQSLAQLEQIFGPDVARQMVPALDALVEKRARALVDPIKSTYDRDRQISAYREAASELELFGKRHPDWKTYETRLNALSQQIQPVGMKQSEWLETLYYLAKREVLEADAAKRASERMAKSAASADDPRAASTVKVTPTRPEQATWDDIVAAAKRGEVWTG